MKTTFGSTMVLKNSKTIRKMDNMETESNKKTGIFM